MGHRKEGNSKSLMPSPFYQLVSLLRKFTCQETYLVRSIICSPHLHYPNMERKVMENAPTSNEFLSFLLTFLLPNKPYLDHFNDTKCKNMGVPGTEGAKFLLQQSKPLSSNHISFTGHYPNFGIGSKNHFLPFKLHYGPPLHFFS